VELCKAKATPDGVEQKNKLQLMKVQRRRYAAWVCNRAYLCLLQFASIFYTTAQKVNAYYLGLILREGSLCIELGN
jgi:hypothetical protein